MSSPPFEFVSTDFLILGSGVGGLRAAIELAPHGSVLMVNKGPSLESATGFAQGGIAVAMQKGDTWAAHLEDTMRAGKGLCRRDSVEALVMDGPSRIEELIAWGGSFDREGDRYLFAREGAHSRARILHAGGDATGAEILKTLFRKAATFGTVTQWGNCTSLDLLLGDGVCLGAILFREGEARPVFVGARGVLLATGGTGQVYARTTNPPGTTGDGMAMSHRIGAQLTDMEFVQFHPTALHLKGAPSLLLTEAMRGEGARLLNASGTRFMPGYHSDAELAPRDVASRAILEEIERSKADHVFLDITHLKESYLKKRFPTIYKTCLAYGLDISSDTIPISPSAHFMIGGVKTDLHGKASVPGLFAAGEVASNGVHGANRLASNSLLEGLVFGARAGSAMGKQSLNRETAIPAIERLARDYMASLNPQTGLDLLSLDEDRRQLTDLMWRKVGIVRDKSGLRDALDEMGRMDAGSRPKVLSRQGAEFGNLLTIAKVMTQAALLRVESRGVHFRSDFPEQSAAWDNRHTYFPLPESSESLIKE